MPSHLKPGDPRPPGVSELDVIGNDFADIEAGTAAEKHKVDLNASSQHLYYRNLAGKVQRRMVAIIQNLPERKVLEKQAPTPSFSPDLDKLLAFSNHVLFENGNWIKCARCANSKHRNSANIRNWILTDCPDIGETSDRPRPFPMELCIVGNKTVHPTHRLNLFRSRIYCRVCGYKAGTRGGGFLKLLAEPCPGEPLSNYGVENLKNYREGKMQDKDDRQESLSLEALEKAKNSPASNFVLQLLEDIPGISAQEAQAVATNMLRCAEFAASLSEKPPIAQSKPSTESTLTVLDKHTKIKVAKPKSTLPPKVVDKPFLVSTAIVCPSLVERVNRADIRNRSDMKSSSDSGQDSKKPRTNNSEPAKASSPIAEAPAGMVNRKVAQLNAAGFS